MMGKSVLLQFRQQSMFVCSQLQIFGVYIVLWPHKVSQVQQGRLDLKKIFYVSKLLLYLIFIPRTHLGQSGSWGAEKNPLLNLESEPDSHLY